MIIRKEIKNTISEEQMAMLEALKDREPEPDEDCPELTDEEALNNPKIVGRNLYKSE